MSRRGAEGKALEEWLQQLGYHSQLKQEEIQSLLSPNMRSVWRHLQTYVKPVQTVQTIRKNLLLAKLQKENIKLENVGNFKIQSRKELTLVERVSDIQREIHSKNSERNVVDDEIKSLMCTIAENKYNLISQKNKIKEVEDKTILLNLKLAQVQKDIEKLDEDNSKATTLVSFHKFDTYTGENSNVSNIATYLLNNKLKSESECSDDKGMLLSLLKKYPAKTVYQGFLLASDSVCKSLKHFCANLEIPEEHMKEILASSGALSSSTHLNNLNSLILHNQLNIFKCLENIRQYSTILNEEKVELVNLIIGIYSNSDDGSNEYLIEEAEEFVEELVNNSVNTTKGDKLKELMDELEADCFEYDNLKKIVEYNKNKEEELNKEVSKKVNVINELYSKIYKYNSKADLVKNEMIESCNQCVSIFLSNLLKQKDLKTVVKDSEDMVIDEVKMFHDAPLSALTRRWENSYELLSTEVLEEISTYPELHMFLLETEPKNILKSVLEKKWWSYILSEQNLI